MAERLRIDVDHGRGRAVVMRVRGRIDGHTAPDLMKRGLAEQAPDRDLILNLSEVTFISSAGVGALMVLAETAGRQGGSLRLAPASEAVLSVLEILNLDQFLQIDASESAGLKAIGG
jgi:anti-anti-sigma factor